MLPSDVAEHVFWPDRDVMSAHRWLRAAIATAPPDVVFVPTARWVDLGSAPVLIMVRNMEPLVLPFGGNTLAESVRNLARRRAAHRACARATRIVAVSDFVRGFLTERWRMRADKVAVVYHGVDLPASGAPGDQPATVPIDVARGPFLLAAGSIRPARGLEDLVSAVALLAARGVQIPAVIAGSVSGGASYQRRIDSLAATLGVSGLLTWAGHLSASELSWCYKRCAAFVMSSRVEACPNTALEALAHGTVTVSSTRAPMPEFFGDAALYYPSGDSTALADCLSAALAFDATDRERYARRGVDVARTFTWERTSTMTLDELEQCHRAPSRSYS